MRAKKTPDPRHHGRLSRLASLALTLAIGGCFVDEAPESSEGGSSEVTDPSTTEPTTLSTEATAATADTGTDSTTSVSDTSASTSTSTSTSSSNTTGDSDTTDTTDPTGTSTTGGQSCAEPEPELELAMTSTCVEGTALLSANFGHTTCAVEFGETWRWLEFHDGEAIGWTAYGTWQSPIGAGERGWVWIKDNVGQCWSSTHGMTWYRPEGDSCKAGCAPATGLEEPGFDPLPGKCNPYEGDTPCDLCRRLICVRG